jgi:hypothetical protein
MFGSIEYRLILSSSSRFRPRLWDSILFYSDGQSVFYSFYVILGSSFRPLSVFVFVIIVLCSCLHSVPGDWLFLRFYFIWCLPVEYGVYHFVSTIILLSFARYSTNNSPFFILPFRSSGSTPEIPSRRACRKERV